MAHPSTEVVDLQCASCNETFPFGPEEQQLFLKRHFDQPKRCHNCRLLKKLSILDRTPSQGSDASSVGSADSDMRVELERQRIQIQLLRAQIQLSRKPSASSTLCRRYFKTGSCHHGINCKFLHIDSPSTTVAREYNSSTKRPTDEPTPTHETLLDGSVVSVTSDMEFDSGSSTDKNVSMDSYTPANSTIRKGNKRSHGKGRNGIRQQQRIASTMHQFPYSHDTNGYSTYYDETVSQGGVSYPPYYQTDMYGRAYGYQLPGGGMEYYSPYPQYDAQNNVLFGGGYNRFGAPTSCSCQCPPCIYPPVPAGSDTSIPLMQGVSATNAPKKCNGTSESAENDADQNVLSEETCENAHPNQNILA